MTLSLPYTPTCACDGVASVFAGEYCHRALPDGAEPRSLGCLREKTPHSGGGTTRDLADVSERKGCLTSGPRTSMRETATWAQRHLATTMVVETRCTPIRRPRRLVMAREGACDALFVTETATYRHHAVKHRGCRPSLFARSWAPHLATSSFPFGASGREVVLRRRCAGHICSAAPRRRHSGKTPPQLKSPKRPGSSWGARALADKMDRGWAKSSFLTMF